MLVENEIVMRPINTIKPYIRNPRKNDKTVELRCKIIPKVGFNVPLVIDEKGIIVKGHARFTAAIRLGMTEVPCIITHADEEAIKADRIADNKISEFSEWSNAELFAEVNEMNFDLSDIGLPKINFDEIPSADDVKTAVSAVADNGELTDEERQRIMATFAKEQADAQGPSNGVGDALGDDIYYKVVCNKCGHIMFFKEDDVNRGEL